VYGYRWKGAVQAHGSSTLVIDGGRQVLEGQRRGLAVGRSPMDPVGYEASWDPALRITRRDLRAPPGRSWSWMLSCWRLGADDLRADARAGRRWVANDLRAGARAVCASCADDLQGMPGCCWRCGRGWRASGCSVVVVADARMLCERDSDVVGAEGADGERKARLLALWARIGRHWGARRGLARERYIALLHGGGRSRRRGRGARIWHQAHWRWNPVP
jgi:hypothetical protein